MARTKRKKIPEKELPTYRKKYNVPNWQNIKEYDYVKNLTQEGLRWEFLRRDKTYRDEWNKKETYGYMQYGLNAWFDPSEKIVPKFSKPCHLVEFSESDPMKQMMHYNSFSSTRGIGDLIFSISTYHPIKPQLALIQQVHNKYYKLHVSPKENRKRPSRKNNKNGRDPTFLLRVLDADNEGISIDDIADAFGGVDSISESAMRRTINFAQDFWRRME